MKRSLFYWLGVGLRKRNLTLDFYFKKKPLSEKQKEEITEGWDDKDAELAMEMS